MRGRAIHEWKSFNWNTTITIFGAILFSFVVNNIFHQPLLRDIYSGRRHVNSSTIVHSGFQQCALLAKAAPVSRVYSSIYYVFRTNASGGGITRDL